MPAVLKGLMVYDSSRWRSAFSAVNDGFVQIVSLIGASSYDDPALGVWTVRDLVGHSYRVLTRLKEHIESPAASYTIDDPLEYYRLGKARRATTASSIAQSGKEAGATLGADPAGLVREVSARVLALVARTSDELAVAAPVASISFAAYLPTRVFELTVHSLDLMRALALDQPGCLDEPIAASLGLASAIAAGAEEPGALLLALTGRTTLPEHFSVI